MASKNSGKNLVKQMTMVVKQNENGSWGVSAGSDGITSEEVTNLRS